MHSRSGRPHTPPSAPPENEPQRHATQAAQYHHVAEAPQQQAAPQQQDAHDDLDIDAAVDTDAVDKHQTDTGEAEAPENDMHDPAAAHTPDTALGPPYVRWTRLRR